MSIIFSIKISSVETLSDHQDTLTKENESSNMKEYFSRTSEEESSDKRDKNVGI